MARDCSAYHSSYLTEHKDLQTGLKLSSLEKILKKNKRNQLFDRFDQRCAKSVKK